MRVIINTVSCLLLLVTTGQAQTKPSPKNSSVTPFILGEVHQLRSSELNEKRILNIYLPAGYNKNDTARYPVVYLLDGSADEDFIHVVGLFQFNNFPWIARVPNSIVVGIANTNRRRDFTYPTTLESDKKIINNGGGSGRFISFIEKELQPYIQSAFNTNGAAMLIGQSLGGLLATEILLKKPQLFDKYVIISPSLWWDDGSLLKLSSALLSEDYKKLTDVYIGVGKEGTVPGTSNRVMEEDAKLLAEKLRSSKNKNLRVHFDYLPAENHATVTHQAVFNALRLLYPQ
jgi:uncharacterized protein